MTGDTRGTRGETGDKTAEGQSFLKVFPLHSMMPLSISDSGDGIEFLKTFWSFGTV